MQLEYVQIKRFKNLIDFEILFDKSETKTVLIGQNASGKSNFLEAVVLIFKFFDLDFKSNIYELEQGFKIKYRCYGNDIEVHYNSNPKKKCQIFVDGDIKGQDYFISEKNQFLPRYILAYYSGLGNSNRLEEHFEDHKAAFARLVIKSDKDSVPKYPRMQYAELIHSQFSLFSFFIDQRKDLRLFLKEHLFIQDIQSILLPLRQPEWATAPGLSKKDKFWGSTGVVKRLLDYLHDNVAIAPMRDIVNSHQVLWKKERKKFEVVYLYFSDFSKIRQYVKEMKWSSFDFFHVLNTANVSRLFFEEGIKIRVQKKHATKISFKDLSEGEQQLLTVLGLMRFTAGEETLFLLDEPDTHLNPYWRWKYMEFIDEIVYKEEVISTPSTPTTQVIMTSHDPLTIGSLKKEAVRIFRQETANGKIKTHPPAEDPKGMGVAGILTEIFYLQTTLDKETQEQLERRRTLESKKYADKQLPVIEQQELDNLNQVLDNLGFSRITRDPLYQKFQAAFEKYVKPKTNDKPLTEEEVKEQKKIIDKILVDLLKEEQDN